MEKQILAAFYTGMIVLGAVFLLLQDVCLGIGGILFIAFGVAGLVSSPTLHNYTGEISQTRTISDDDGWLKYLESYERQWGNIPEWYYPADVKAAMKEKGYKFNPMYENVEYSDYSSRD